MPDDSNIQWPIDVVAENILQYIEMYRINAVVTFDKHGVSRHKNHISLYFAVAALCIENKVPSCQYSTFLLFDLMLDLCDKFNHCINYYSRL